MLLQYDSVVSQHSQVGADHLIIVFVSVELMIMIIIVLVSMVMLVRFTRGLCQDRSCHPRSSASMIKMFGEASEETPPSLAFWWTPKI